MIMTKCQLKEYIDKELSYFRYPVLAYLPFDLFESQIVAKYLIVLRKAEYHVNLKHLLTKCWYMWRLKRMQNRYGVHIPINTCGKGLSIAHLGTIVVNGDAVIGENCRIHVGVVVGDSGGVPRIGNNVYIGPGAKIFGAINIADNCKIGANAVVNKSFTQKGATLVGVPAKAHTKSN